MVSLLVRATATHELPESVDLPAGYEPADIQFFLDADMAILAADSARYRRYLRGVRREYSHFDNEAFRAGRMTFRAFDPTPRAHLPLRTGSHALGGAREG